MRVATKPKKSKSKKRLLLLALVACGLATTWQLHRTASSRADWFKNLTSGGGIADTKPAEGPAGPRRGGGEGRLIARPGAEGTVGGGIAGEIPRGAVGGKAGVHRGEGETGVHCGERPP